MNIVISCVGLVLVAGLAGCGSSASTSSPSGVSVVASTNVWGDVAAQVGGDRIKVTSIISDTSTDPHSYEANARVQLELKDADVVIENGGGYDDFVDTLLNSVDTRAAVINAVDVSGKRAPAGGELNEHVWYDLPSVARVADVLVERLSAADPSDAGAFRANAAAFKAELTRLEGVEAQLRSKHAGEGVAITEPVPLYLTEAAGLVNRTPEDFSAAVEEGSEMSPVALREQLALFSGKQVRVLVYNEQTSGADTDQSINAAKRNGIPVVPVTETLPSGKDYVGWMRDILAALQAAVG